MPQPAFFPEENIHQTRLGDGSWQLMNLSASIAAKMLHNAETLADLTHHSHGGNAAMEVAYIHSNNGACLSHIQLARVVSIQMLEDCSEVP